MRLKRCLKRISIGLVSTLLNITATGAYAQDSGADGAGAQHGKDVASLQDMFGQGHFSGDLRIISFATRNAFFVPGLHQNTASYGGRLSYETARLYGISLGVSGYLQRGISHSADPTKVDAYLGPNLTELGEAYVKWEHGKFAITAGNQALDVPFASTYYWHIVPQLYQGVSTRYGDADNYLSAFRILRFKSYIDGHFMRGTNYNQRFDAFSPIGNTETDGFWGVGGARKVSLGGSTINGQAWYIAYRDYANLAYLEGRASRKMAGVEPFAGVQYVNETDNGRALLGHVRSQTYGLQLGMKRNSLTLSLGYDYIAPHGDAYLNGAPVTPYAHNVASDPLYAQPFMTSTQDLGAGSAYALDVSGAPWANWFVGARYSFMDLKPAPGSASIDQSEYMAYAVYHFTGGLKGASLANIVALQSSPASNRRFLQDRLIFEYAWGA